jgi:energy-coupling factor transporter ATP-binding protein EcfA2
MEEGLETAVNASAKGKAQQIGPTPSPSTGAGEEEKQSRAVALINLMKELCTLHQDQHGTPFAWIQNPGRVLMLNTKEFKAHTTREFYKKYGEVVGSEALTAALNVLSAEALETEKVPLQVRVARDDDGGILIDLCDKKEEALKIAGLSADLIKIDCPRFRRHSHMKPLDIDFMAVTEVGPDGLRDFLRSFRLKDAETDIMLLTGFIGAALVPDIPHPILNLYGPQGSTKTTLTKALTGMLDPTSTEVLSISDRKDELAQQLAHRYVAPYDNVSKFKTWMVDTLCRASTGEAFTKRALYTDEDDVVFAFRRVVILNGINIPSKRGDFLDRVLMIELSRVPRRERREEEKVAKEIEGWLPGLRAVVFDGLSRAMWLVDEVREELKELPRMADFCIWGEAFCRAMGYDKGAFYKAYMEKVEETSKVALENDVVAELIMKLFAERKEWVRIDEDGTLSWEGTAAELLKLLDEVNRAFGYVNEKQLPQSPETVGRWLNDLAANLADVGIKIFRKKEGKGRTRKIIIIKEKPRAEGEEGKETPSPLPPGPEQGDGDGPLRRSKEPSAPSALSASPDETKSNMADSRADSNQQRTVRQPSAFTEHDETKQADSADRADSSLLSRRGLAPSTLDDDPGSPEKGEPHPPPGLKPQWCSEPDVCGYHGVFINPSDFDEHLRRLHGRVSR